MVRAKWRLARKECTLSSCGLSLALVGLMTLMARSGFWGPSKDMLAKLFSFTLIGIDAAPVEVEVDVSASSMPKTLLMGLAEAAVKESTHRVERAIVNSGYRRPTDPVIVNLVPAKLRKSMMQGDAQTGRSRQFSGLFRRARCTQSRLDRSKTQANRASPLAPVDRRGRSGNPGRSPSTSSAE